MTETVFKLPCGKCGVGIPVEQEMVTNAIALGMPISPEHAVCPGQEPTPDADAGAPVLRRFRLQLVAAEVFTEEELPAQAWDPALGPDVAEILAGIGTTAQGGNLAEVVNGAFTVWLNTQWPKFQESAAYADLPPATPAPNV